MRLRYNEVNFGVIYDHLQNVLTFVILHKLEISVTFYWILFAI